MIINQAERRWLLIATAVALLLANLPSLLGFLFPPAGTHYTGIDATAPGDVNVYRSYLEQVSQGRLILSDIFTSEPQRAAIVSPFWVGLGLLGALLKFSTLLTYFLSRIVFGALLLWLVYRLTAELFDEVRTRRLAWLLSVFGAGLGAWIAPFANTLAGGANLEKIWPMDLWVSEAFTFLSLHHSPHFLAGTILILLTVMFFGRSLERDATRPAVWAGLAMLALYSFHPFHALSLGLVTVGLCILAFVRFRRAGWKFFRRAVVAWIIAAPALIYQAWFALKDPLGAERASQNILFTPPVLTTVLSYGLLFVAGVYGAKVWLRTRKLKYQIIVTWTICHAAAIFVPIFFNRRVTQGLNIALALLAAAGLVAALEQFRRRTGRNPHVVLLSVLIFFGFGMSTIWVTAQDLSFLLGNGRSLPYFFYISNDYQQAFDWLKQNGQEQTVVMSAPITGNFIPGVSGRRVVVGHNVETIRYEDRQRDAKMFYVDGSADDRRRILTDRGVTYVIDGPWERRLGEYDPTAWTSLELVFRTPTVLIYRATVN